MTDHPIIFSVPMVRALLNGRKTQTRRVLKPQPLLSLVPCADRGIPVATNDWGSIIYRPLPYAPGDRLWVREKHWCVELKGGGIGAPYLVYDEEWSTGPGARVPEPAEERPWWGPPYWDDKREIRWGARPSIHMPRWASRLTLVVTDVRVQRVREISEADAIAEGVLLSPDRRPHYRIELTRPNDVGADAVDADRATSCFRHLWDSLNAKRGFGWEADPWVVALTFTVHHQNIDQMQREDAA